MYLGNAGRQMGADAHSWRLRGPQRAGSFGTPKNHADRRRSGDKPRPILSSSFDTSGGSATFGTGNIRFLRWSTTESKTTLLPLRPATTPAQQSQERVQTSTYMYA
jgi:hypothetical protein